MGVGAAAWLFVDSFVFCFGGAGCAGMPLPKISRGCLAESEGFEPPIALRRCLISSQVHSTGLCQLSVLSESIESCAPWLCVAFMQRSGRSKPSPPSLVAGASQIVSRRTTRIQQARLRAQHTPQHRTCPNWYPDFLLTRRYSKENLRCQAHFPQHAQARRRFPQLALHLVLASAPYPS